MDDDFDSGLDFSDSMDTGSSDMGDFDVGSFMDQTPEIPEMEDFSDVGGFEEASFDVGSFMDESAMDMPDPVEGVPEVEDVSPELLEEYEPEVELEKPEEIETLEDYPEEIPLEIPTAFEMPTDFSPEVEPVEDIPEEVEIQEEPIEETVEKDEETGADESNPVPGSFDDGLYTQEESVEQPIEGDISAEPVDEDISAEAEPVEEDVPVEAEPVEEDVPVEAEPAAEDIPAEAEPAVEDISAEAEPVEEDVPVEAEPAAEDIPVETEPVAEDIPAEAEPAVEDISAEAEPVEEDVPVEAEPAAEDIPAEAEPVEEAIPVEVKPAEEKHYDSLQEYLCDHNYGKEDYDTYSKDPEWQRLNNEYLIQNGREPIDNYDNLERPVAEYDGFGPGPAQEALGEYLAEHNYGREDYETYSKDPEWQQLNNDFLQETGREPVDYSKPESTTETIDIQNEIPEEVTVEEIPAETGAVIADTVESIPDTVPPVSIETVDTGAEVETEMPERELDEFETMVAIDDADFYDSGSFYTQGINEYGYTGTCGETSMANTMNRVLGTNEYTENKVLDVAVQEGLCDTDSFDDSGGTTTGQFMELYERMNETCDHQLNVELTEKFNVLSMEEAAQRLEEGCTLNVAVDSATLWDQVDPMGAPFVDSRATDHWITVTGVQRGEDGSILGFDVVDSGGGVDYVDAEKYQAMCYGTDSLELTDPTCIVVSKVDGAADVPVMETEPVRLDDTQVFNKDDELYEQFDSEPEDSDRSFNLLREIYKIFKH